MPTTALANQPLRMRVLLGYAGASNVGLFGPVSWVCGVGNFNDGEVEDYTVLLAPDPLSTTEIVDTKNGIQIYPNPATDILNVTNVSNKAVYEIYGVSGQLLSKGLIRDGKVIISQLINGNYIIKITDQELTNSIKFIKK